MAEAPTNTTALARKWRLDVNAGTALSPVWTQTFGVADLKPMLGASIEDDGAYDDEGWGSSVKTGLAWSIELKLLRKVALSDGITYDPAQELLRAAAEAFGSDGIVHVRWYDRNGGAEAYDGYAEVEWGNDGGNRTSIESVSVTLHGKGARTEIANPA